MNPVSGFPFPLFSMVLPWKSTNRVENTGRQWKQNCCQSTYSFWVSYIRRSLKNHWSRFWVFLSDDGATGARSRGSKDTTESGRTVKSSLKHVIRRPEFGAFAGMILVYAFFAVAAKHGFLTPEGTANWMNTASELGVLAVPVGMLMIAGVSGVAATTVLP